MKVKRIRYKRKRFSCSICKRSFPSYSQYLSHGLTSRTVADSYDSLYCQCPKCSAGSPVRNLGIKVNSTRGRKTVCQECNSMLLLRIEEVFEYSTNKCGLSANVFLCKSIQEDNNG